MKRQRSQVFNLKLLIMSELIKLLNKTPYFFKGDFIGCNYIFDYDIEIFVSSFNEIDDYSGCSFATAKKLINQKNTKK